MWFPNGTLVYCNPARRFAYVTAYFDGRYHLRPYQHPEQPTFKAKKREVYEAYESFAGCVIADPRTPVHHPVMSATDWAYAHKKVANCVIRGVPWVTRMQITAPPVQSFRQRHKNRRRR